MSSWTELCHKYLIKKNWSKKTVYSFGKCYKGCYFQSLYWHNAKWFSRMYRTWYQLDMETHDFKKVKHRLFNKYCFKNYKKYLR